MTSVRALRGPMLSFHADPFLTGPEPAWQFLPDALIILAEGHILGVGDYAASIDALPAGTPIDAYPDCLILPGFIDAHVHYPQMQMIGAYGANLLDWLEHSTFVAEQQFADAAHAATISRQFLRELLRAGTTTAAVYCTVHPQSVDAFFAESARFNTRMIAGKVLMDRNAPAALCDTAESGMAQSQALIARWHQSGRQLYAVTPRFAASSTARQLDLAGALWRDNPGTFMQTHLAENTDEVAWTQKLFPDRTSYLDVYHHAGLTGQRAIFGHAVHLDEADFACCHQTGSALAHCPTSNLFLGSGLFRAFDAKRADRPVRIGLGTDLGAGTSFCHLQTMGEAYKIAQLNATRLDAAHAFYLATRGGAEALYLQNQIGSIAPGYEADLVVLDPRATELLAFRQEYCANILDRLFVLMTLGDDRAVRATYVAGQPVYLRDRTTPFRYAEDFVIGR